MLMMFWLGCCLGVTHGTWDACSRVLVLQKVVCDRLHQNLFSNRFSNAVRNYSDDDYDGDVDRSHNRFPDNVVDGRRNEETNGGGGNPRDRHNIRSRRRRAVLSFDRKLWCTPAWHHITDATELWRIKQRSYQASRLTNRTEAEISLIRAMYVHFLISKFASIMMCSCLVDKVNYFRVWDTRLMTMSSNYVCLLRILDWQVHPLKS